MDIHRVYRFFERVFRRKRMAQFVELFGIRDRDEILDIGGLTRNWRMISQRPKIVLLNLDPTAQADDKQFQFVQADARDLPYPDKHFRTVYSNSVIEHVGDATQQQRFADEIRRVSDGYYVQTPNKYFPIEPHFLTLGLHALPRGIKRKLLRWMSVWGLMTRPSQPQVDDMMDSIRLLSTRDMKRLFPDAQIIFERLLFLKKSIIAVRLNKTVDRATGNGQVDFRHNHVAMASGLHGTGTSVPEQVDTSAVLAK